MHDIDTLGTRRGGNRKEQSDCEGLLMRTILIVEDNPANMKLAVTVLEQNGHTVLQAADAEKSMRPELEKIPDLSLMDIQLPGIDGLEATRQIKTSRLTQHIPVYALTSFAMQGDAESFRQGGWLSGQGA